MLVSYAVVKGGMRVKGGREGEEEGKERLAGYDSVAVTAHVCHFP